MKFRLSGSSDHSLLWSEFAELCTASLLDCKQQHRWPGRMPPQSCHGDCLNPQLKTSEALSAALAAYSLTRSSGFSVPEVTKPFIWQQAGVPQLHTVDSVLRKAIIQPSAASPGGVKPGRGGAPPCAAISSDHHIGVKSWGTSTLLLSHISPR